MLFENHSAFPGAAMFAGSDATAATAQTSAELVATDLSGGTPALGITFPPEPPFNPEQLLGDIVVWALKAAAPTNQLGQLITTAAESAYATMFQTPELHGPPKYFTIDWGKSRSSVEALAALRPNLLISGHGRAMEGAGMTQALAVLAQDFDQVAVPARGRYVGHPATAEDGSAYVNS